MRVSAGIMSVGFVLEPEFDPGVPRLVAGHAIGTEATDMTMTPDAQRFITRVTDIGTPDGVRPRIEVILNWFDELKARVPTGR